MIRDEQYHIPVLVDEVISLLKIRQNGLYIDATLGGGGHAVKIMEKGAALLAIDGDQDAIDHFRSVLEKKGIRLVKGISDQKYNFNILHNTNIFLARGNFKHIKKIAESINFTKVDGILFDLGISSHQLDLSNRGFSFQKDEPLDMRMDKREKLTAEIILNHFAKGELYDIFSTYAEEINSRRISESIIRARSLKHLETTSDLLNALGLDKDRFEHRKELARIFQSIRIAVNDELINLKKALAQSADLLKTNGRLVFITFHSLEDRIVKLKMRKEKFREITKKPLTAQKEELLKNSRSKSAKVRVYEKI